MRDQVMARGEQAGRRDVATALFDSSEFGFCLRAFFGVDDDGDAYTLTSVLGTLETSERAGQTFVREALLAEMDMGCGYRSGGVRVAEALFSGWCKGVRESFAGHAAGGASYSHDA